MDVDAVTVRAAVDADLGAQVVGGPDGEYREQLRELLGGSEGTVLLVASLAAVGPAPVGRVGVRTASGTAEILGLVVDDPWRRRGVGTALMDAAESWASARGCAKVRLTVGQDNTDAIRLYDARGYRVIGTGASDGLVAADGTVVHEPESVWICRKDLRAG